ncbi:uncharacterized protein LOC106162820 [Lingula anatina]|uniref:Uncharacterized protein LOC106162820 n=1 Tax=Lingula anatina TaxID=7574 RepID=A0A1S3IBS8_LINAN|nr:uncharacterized protein LOC106162820 [Lingula anatina]|eukprot:XP_013395697.1 uncharacterized protein LOC106162820 [Lingula anatina]
MTGNTNSGNISAVLSELNTSHSGPDDGPRYTKEALGTKDGYRTGHYSAATENEYTVPRKLPPIINRSVDDVGAAKTGQATSVKKRTLVVVTVTLTLIALGILGAFLAREFTASRAIDVNTNTTERPEKFKGSSPSTTMYFITAHSTLRTKTQSTTTGDVTKRINSACTHNGTMAWVMTNVYFNDGTFLSAELKHSLDDCVVKCRNDKACKGGTYHSPSYSCYILDEVRQTGYSVGWSAFVMAPECGCEMMEFQNLSLFRIYEFITEVSYVSYFAETAQNCSQSCRVSATCEMADFYPPGKVNV